MGGSHEQQKYDEYGDVDVVRDSGVQVDLEGLAWKSRKISALR